MLTTTIVFFYLAERKAARNYPWQKGRFPIHESTWLNRKLVLVGIPEYDWGVRAWKADKLAKRLGAASFLDDDANRRGGTVFLCHRQLWKRENLRSGIEANVPVEAPGAFVPVDIAEELLQEYCDYDALILLDRAEGDGGYGFDPVEFLLEHSLGINYLGIATTRGETFEDVLEEIYEEYGLVASLAEDLKSFHVPVGRKLLTVDAGSEMGRRFRDIPGGCIYLDLTSSEEKERHITTKRKDIRYISFYLQVEKKFRSVKGSF